MKHLFIFLALSVPLILTGCKDDDDDPKCEKVEQGCYSNYEWSCSGADNCYASKSGCEASSECD